MKALTISLYFFLVACSGNALFGLTSKLHDISLIEKYIDDGALLCWSVENVLCVPTSMLGSMQHVANTRSQPPPSNVSIEDYDQQAVNEWIAINNLCDHQVVHPSVADTIVSLSLKKVSMIGLSVADSTSATMVLDNLYNNETFLSESGIRFPNVFLHDPDHSEECLRHPLMEENILFTGALAENTTVANAFLLFLNSLETKPSRIIYVDGNAENILAMEEACSAEGIYFIGVSYKPAEKKFKNYDYKVAELQKMVLTDHLSETFFHNILSSLQEKMEPTPPLSLLLEN